MAKQRKPKRKKKSDNVSQVEKIAYITAILSLINGLLMLINNIISLTEH